MRSQSLFFLMNVLVVSVYALSSPATLLAADSGFEYSMFDGKTLGGWTAENGCRAQVVDGTIQLESGDGWLRSDHTYSDFDLHIEWRTLKPMQYDAGVYLRAGADGAPFPKRGYQTNLKQGREGNIHSLKGAASQGLAKPAGQWNTFDITVVGQSVSMVINGTPAYQVDGLSDERGYIGIQVEVPLGGQFQFKNIRVSEHRHQSLFNGADFAGWEGAGAPAEACWRVQDGVLSGLKKKGPWLRSKQRFDDFNLRLEYQVAAGANSGVYVRVPPDGKHHRDKTSDPAAGFEVQLLDDSAPKHAHLKEYQYSGSVYDIAGATAHVSRTPGKWNTLELNCRGHHVTSIHNGVRIVDIDAERRPLLALRQLEGHLGLQNHGGDVNFRKIRVGPAIEE